MIRYLNGQVIPLTVNENLDRCYFALVKQFPQVSRAQFNGSREFEVAYMVAQHEAEDSALLAQTLNSILNVGSVDAERLLAANTLQYRLDESMRAHGYIVNVENLAGELRIAVSRKKADGSAISINEYQGFAEILAAEYIPLGTITTFGSTAQGDKITRQVNASSDQSNPSQTNNVDVSFVVSPDVKTQRALHIKVELVLRGAQIGAQAIYQNRIANLVLSRWNGSTRLGKPIIPQELLKYEDIQDIAISMQLLYAVTASGVAAPSDPAKWNVLPSNHAAAVNQDYNPEYWEEFDLQTPTLTII